LNYLIRAIWVLFRSDATKQGMGKACALPPAHETRPVLLIKQTLLYFSSQSHLLPPSSTMIKVRTASLCTRETERLAVDLEHEKERGRGCEEEAED